jgi:hypothetical protein
MLRLPISTGNGGLDIVVGGYLGSYWLENPLRHGKDPYASTWPVHLIDPNLPSHDVVVGDINHDNRLPTKDRSGSA